MDARRALPEFVPPMLARLGEPFDSERHLFEVKWDGMRTLAFVEGGTVRLVNRQRHDVTARFPELGGLASLEAGLLLDGEIVVTVAGRPDFRATMSRVHTRSEARIRSGSRSRPATYVAFDLLYRDFEPLVEQPLRVRRAALEDVVGAADEPRLLLSDGVVGQGRALFAQAAERRLEGVVGKDLDSPYRPGRRSDAWVKIKVRQSAVCVVLGFLPEGTDDVKSIVVGMEDEGELRSVGQVGSGIGRERREQLNAWLWQHLRDRPIVPSPARGARWVEPGLYCVVSYSERTPDGNLRAPVLEEILPPRS